LLGLLGLAGAATLTVLTFFSDRAATPVAKSVTSSSIEALGLAEQSRRSAETIIPLGMGQALSERWAVKNRNGGRWIIRASDIATYYGGLSRFFRMALQSAALGLGAYLIINGRASGGVMIASSILLGRALAPVELAIAHWRGFLSARQALTRLDELLAGGARSAAAGLGLPRPGRTLAVNQLAVVAPGTQTLILKEATFALEAGDSLGVLGPSGSGKSTLLRALVGLHAPVRGAVRLDGSTLDQWAPGDWGRFVGYLPQQVELFAGTIAENISRFEITADSDAVLAAATLAGVDALIRGMPQGFDTPVGEGGGRLSAGQRQRIALARALYRDPFLLVLDEPNSALDVEGEAALTRAITAARQRGAIIVAAVHRVSGMEAMNKLLILGEGVQRAFGPRDEVLQKARAAGQGGSRLEVVPSP
jgi:ATP-binding cassette subfamily C protein